MRGCWWEGGDAGAALGSAPRGPRDVQRAPRAYQPQCFLPGGWGRPAAGLLGRAALLEVLLAMRNALLLLAGMISFGVQFWDL